MKTLRTILMVVLIVMAVLASVWSFQAWRYRGDRLYFVDGLLPKRSVEAFNHQAPPDVQEDILIAHERGVTASLIPFVASTVLWFLAFVVSIVGLKQRRNTTNPTSEGIRQPADGLPKPSM